MLVGDVVSYFKNMKFMLGFIGLGGLTAIVIFIIICFFIKKMFFNIYFVIILIVIVGGLVLAAFLFRRFGGPSAGKAMISMPGILNKLCKKKESDLTKEEKKWCGLYSKSLKNVNMINELFKKKVTSKKI